MTAHVFALHGIANDARERLEYGGRWESILRGQGFDVELTPCPWASSGYALADIAKLNSPARERILDECLERFGDWYETVPDDEPAIVLGHSMGGIIAPEIVRRCAFVGSLITIGSPITHPVLGIPFTKHAPHTTINVAFFNRRDPIAAFLRMTRDLEPRWNAHEVSFGDGIIDQHAAELYLSNSVFVSVFADLADVGN